MRLFILSVLFSTTTLIGCDKKSENNTHDIPIPTMSVQDVSEMTFLYMDVRGSFEQHPALINELQEYLESNGIKIGDCIGIYFDDPDAVSASELNWQIGFEIFDSNVKPNNDFKIRKLKKTKAIVVDSKVEFMPSHGLYSEVWMLEHGYVQIRPSRTIYHLDHENPLQANTTIVYPIVERSRIITTLTSSTL